MKASSNKPTLRKLGHLTTQQSWNLSSSSSSKTTKIERAVGLLSSINPTTPSKSYIETCGSLLKQCAKQDSVSITNGSIIHGHVIKIGISSHRFIAIKLLIMYLNSKKSVECGKIFKEIDEFNLVAWNCMINALVRDGDLAGAVHLFDEMPERNAISWTTLIAGFMKFGKVDDAIWYFERNPFQNVVTWTAAVSGFVQNGLNFEGLMIFREMLERGIAPNNITFTCVVKACVSVGDFGLGRSVLGVIVKIGFERNLSVCNSLITLFLRMGEIDLARRVFDGMEEKDVVSWTAILDVCVEMGELGEAHRIFDEMPERNVVSWSAMIARYSQNGDAEEALALFAWMVYDGFRPNVSCFSSILSSLASLEALQLGRIVHGYVIKIGIEEEVYIGSPLIYMYCKCGETEDGSQVFNLISNKNVVIWNAMVVGYSYNGLLEEAKALFERIPMRNVVSWNTIIAGYVQNEHCEEVLEVFNSMLLSGEMPNGSTFPSVLRACASLASLEKGKNLHGKIIKLGAQNEVFVGTALTDMYAKSGDIESCKRVFDRMPEKNEISWTAMIQGLADNGLAEESLTLFEEMERSGVAPTELVFLGVLFACSHCGLVDRGFRYFESMKTVYGIKQRGKHYTCMVDLLARAGRLSEAEQFIQGMPFQPEANAWAALLSACSRYGNDEMGERTARKLWELEKENSAGYVLLSNIYASAGRWSDVSKVRRLMRENGSKKCGGCSWVQIRNQVHTFFVEDQSYSESSQIYGILELLMSEMMV